MATLKKTLRRIKKVSKKLLKEEREILLRGLQDFLEQSERLLSKSRRGKGTPAKARRAETKAPRRRKDTKAPTPSADGPTEAPAASTEETPSPMN